MPSFNDTFSIFHQAAALRAAIVEMGAESDRSDWRRGVHWPVRIVVLDGEGGLLAAELWWHEDDGDLFANPDGIKLHVSSPAEFPFAFPLTVIAFDMSGTGDVLSLGYKRTVDA
ncbi:MAG: hypothetical protein ACREUF_02620 [Solimonas sp.]